MFLFAKHTNEQEKSIKKFLKNILGCRPGNIFLYKTALTHKSSSCLDSKGNKINNERLEFLGDTVLSTIVGDYLFKKYPHKGEGFLTEMRAKIVSRSSLNTLAKKIGLVNLIEYSKTSNIGIAAMSGNAFEALTGALYLDKGYKNTYKILISRIFTVYMDVAEVEKTQWNYKSKIIDWAQKNKKKISFQVIDVVDIEHRKQYNTAVFIDNIQQENAVDFSIKAAEQLASEKTYKHLVEKGIIAS
ncbi:MAG: ribonuclease III [Bacteroidota bacterium]|nr:ribonuclease III [Bacteroidota bacterium]